MYSQKHRSPFHSTLYCPSSLPFVTVQRLCSYVMVQPCYIIAIGYLSMFFVLRVGLSSGPRVPEFGKSDRSWRATFHPTSPTSATYCLGHHSVMHDALFISELLHAIIRDLDIKDQARVAQVCKVFWQTVIEHIWTSLPAFEPLLHLLNDDGRSSRCSNMEAGDKVSWHHNLCPKD